VTDGLKDVMMVDVGEEGKSAGDVRCSVYVYHPQPPTVTYKLFKLRVAFCQPQSMKAAEMLRAFHKEIERASERVRHEVLTRMTSIITII
jgi:hypothetical protein